MKKNKLHYLYKITNIINNKIYIGYTNNIKQRWSDHKSHVKSKEYNRPLYNAIRKYGINNFNIIVIAMAKNVKYAKVSEKQLIKQYDCKHRKNNSKGYNLTDGGEGISGYKMSSKTKKILSEYGKKNPNNTIFKKGHKLAIGENNGFYGKIHSDKTKKQISKSRKGKYIGEQNHNFGKHLSQETKLKLSKALKGNNIGEDHPRAKLTYKKANIIKEIYNQENISQRKLAKIFKVSQKTICDVINGLKWVNKGM